MLSNVVVLSTSPLVAINVKLTGGILELSKTKTSVPLVEFNLNLMFDESKIKREL